MKLVDCIYSDNLTEAQKILNHFIEENEINGAFQEACSLGRSDFVTLLLKDARVNPRYTSIQAMEYAVSPNVNGSFGLQQACYNGHADVVDLLLNDKRSDPSAGNYRCIKLIVDKAESQDNYKQILKKLTDYCWNNYLDYQSALGSKLSAKIDKILAATAYNSNEVAYTKTY